MSNKLSSITALLTTYPGIFALGCLLGAVLMYASMQADNSRLRQELERRDALFNQEMNNIYDTKNMSQNELKSWVHELHEQNRITREVQNRLHKQEIALSSTPVYLIGITMTLVGLLAWIVHQSHKHMSNVAVNTIRTAISLTPPSMLKVLLTAQNEVNATMTAKPANNADSKLDNKGQNQKHLR